MMFFSKGKKGATAPQKPTMLRSALRVAFNPEIGTSLRPLEENINIFTQLLASIFVGQKMFPANHPALVGGAGVKKLTLISLLAEVWRNLKISKETMPQVLMFAAVVVSLFFGVLAFVIMVMSVLSGTAHAQGYFDPPGGDGDIAQQWIDFLFHGGSVGSFISQFGQPLMQSQSIQDALMTALAFYSDAILIVAAVILFYHLTSMVVETAHHGKVMGKRANEVWAPIRLVFAIGLLVPIAGGLNSGQHIVVRIAEWGSGMASNVWAIFLERMLENAAWGQGVPGNSPYVRQVVYNTALMEACKEAYNKLNEDQGKSISSVKNQIDWRKFDLGPGGKKRLMDKKNVVATDQGVCGHVVFKAKQQTGGGVEQQTQQFVGQQAESAWDSMDQELQQWVQENVKYFIPKDPSGNGGNVGKNDEGAKKNEGKFEDIVRNYQQQLEDGIPVPDFASTFMQSATDGWVSAGAFFNVVARAQAAAMDLGGMLPETKAPEFKKGNDPTLGQDTVRAVIQFEQWMTSQVQGGMAQGGGGGGGGNQRCENSADIMKAAQALAQMGPGQDNILERIFQIIDWIASKNCMWRSAQGMTSNGGNFSLGVMFLSANPLAEMAAFGHSSILAAYDTFDSYIKLMATGTFDMAGYKAGRGEIDQGVSGFSNNMSEAGEKNLSAIGAILTAIIGIFFMSGIMLAFILPLIPFFRFLFNIMTWFLSLLEAIIAVPLVALAHLTPEGEGLPGQHARVAYYYIFSVFLYPVMMVFALIVALLIFFIAVSYMNDFYMAAVITSGGLANGHLFLSRLLYTAIYVITLYMAANASFKAIDFLPQHAVKWMGGQALHFLHMGDPQQISGVVMQGAGMVESKIVGAAGQLAQSQGLKAGTLGGGAGMGLISGMNPANPLAPLPGGGGGDGGGSAGDGAAPQIGPAGPQGERGGAGERGGDGAAGARGADAAAPQIPHGGGGGNGGGRS